MSKISKCSSAASDGDGKVRGKEAMKTAPGAMTTTAAAVHSSQVKIGGYLLGETLGSGTFGKVKIGSHETTGHKVAIKVVNRQKMRSLKVVSKILREIQNLKLFRHPHIIKLYQVICTPTDIFMVMEYVRGGDLFQYITKRGKLDEVEARRFFQQVISGVDYCHRHMIVHRDLKPENLLLDQYLNIKIADFGLSSMMTDGEFLRTSCGSPNYAAPEIIAGKLYAGPEVDVWSCGILLYALLCGCLPFDDDNVSSLFRKVKNSLYTIPEDINRSAASLIKRMLSPDQLKRATIKDVMESEWFKVDFPQYLFPSVSDMDASVVDLSAVREVAEKCCVVEADVQKALLSGDPQDQLVIAYNLIVDNKRLDDSERLRIQDFFSASELRSKSFPSRPHPEKMPEISTTATLEPIATEEKKNTATKKAKWHLGIRSQSKPSEIMHEVYRAMKRLNYEWKTVNPFHIRVRNLNRLTGEYVKLSVQLYQVDQKNYVLDFRSLDADEHPDAVRVRNMVHLASSASAPGRLQDGSKASSPSKTSSLSKANSPSPVLEDDDSDDRTPHKVIEFFEMCGSLIQALAG